MSLASLIRVSSITAGFLTESSDRRGVTFRTLDQRFATLDGSAFPNFGAAQRAAERLAAIIEHDHETRRAG